MTAYCTGKLRTNDYRILHCYLAAHVLVGLFGYLETLAKEKPHNEPIIATTILHIMWCGISMFGTVAAKKKMTPFEIVLLITSYILIYTVGIYYLYEGYDMELLKKDKNDLYFGYDREEYD